MGTLGPEQVTESWAGPGNEANSHLVGALFICRKGGLDFERMFSG